MPSSVQELLAAAQAKKSPFIDLLEGVAGGIINSQGARAAREKLAHDRAVEKQARMMAYAKAARDQEIADEERARAKETHQALLAKINGAVETDVAGKFGAVGNKPTPAAPGLRLVKVTTGSDGYLKPEFKDVTPKPAAPPKAPAGYRYLPNGNMEAIPGGPADAKLSAAEEKKRSAQMAAVDQADLILSKVKQAEDLTGSFTVGWGSALKGVPGSSAKDLRSVVETLKANLGFEALAKMRANSPTGGALGNISDSEMRLLTAAVTSLEQSQSQAQFRSNLQEVRKRYKKIADAIRQDAIDTRVNAAVEKRVIQMSVPGYEGTVEVEVEGDN